ncbi:hypothetical protein N7456_003721 [Penicillium angulare]|uniref:Uncharacterized protein n=1 Tax=Penicillium angulare TaxID=116970 RepID=A0A9W9FV80_9EURO|nr:hypothetical protein N7456_003721 [Penicillium angulare]
MLSEIDHAVQHEPPIEAMDTDADAADDAHLSSGGDPAEHATTSSGQVQCLVCSMWSTLLENIPCTVTNSVITPPAQKVARIGHIELPLRHFARALAARRLESDVVEECLVTDAIPEPSNVNTLRRGVQRRDLATEHAY